MGKSKSNKQKNAAKAFKVSGAKVCKIKNKAKAVTTNIKKLNLPSKSKTEQSDVQFQSVQNSLTKRTKGQTQKPASQPAQQKPKSVPQPRAPVDVNAAGDALAKLDAFT